VIGLLPVQEVVMQAATDLPKGLPIVLQLETGQTYDLDDLTRMAGVAGESGRDVVILLGEE